MSSSPVVVSGAAEGGPERVCGVPVIGGGAAEGGGEGLGGEGES